MNVTNLTTWLLRQETSHKNVSRACRTTWPNSSLCLYLDREKYQMFHNLKVVEIGSWFAGKWRKYRTILEGHPLGYDVRPSNICVCVCPIWVATYSTGPEKKFTPTTIILQIAAPVGRLSPREFWLGPSEPWGTCRNEQIKPYSLTLAYWKTTRDVWHGITLAPCARITAG